MSIDYHEYIKSDAWRKRAMSAKRRAKWRCQVCNSKGKHATLNAHHRTYERLGNEWPTDLVVLCKKCHTLFSKNMPSEPDLALSEWILLFKNWGLRKEGDPWSMYEYGKGYLARTSRMTPAWYENGLRALATWFGI